jgi:hypothetical protein
VAGGSGLSSAELYGFATVRTDKADYTVGETVTITGSGWEPGETVALLLQEVPKTHDDRTLQATADAAGNILNSDFQPEEHDAASSSSSPPSVPRRRRRRRSRMLRLRRSLPKTMKGRRRSMAISMTTPTAT